MGIVRPSGRLNASVFLLAAHSSTLTSQQDGLLTKYIEGYRYVLLAKAF